ncbi:hypothetical protein [Streptomyces sp. NPDC090021]|uniref:hypothetical protein n=1 Tax=Streptomyces sp. NPDC090021 TaxID=3365919 RepID=UPI003807AB83
MRAPVRAPGPAVPDASATAAHETTPGQYPVDRDQALCGRTAPKPPQAPKVPKRDSVEGPAALPPALPVLPAPSAEAAR